MQIVPTAFPTLLLADDNLSLLETLVEMLQATYKVLGAFSDGNSVLSDIFALNPDILLLDISLGDLNGFEVARRLRERGSSAKIIFLSVHEDVEFVTASFDAGACGYVFKARAAALKARLGPRFSICDLPNVVRQP